MNNSKKKNGLYMIANYLNYAQDCPVEELEAKKWDVQNWANRLHGRSAINKNIVQSSNFMITLQQQLSTST